MMALFIYPLLIFFARTVDRFEKGTEPEQRPILSDEATRKQKGRYWFSSFHGHMGAVLGPSLLSTSTFILRITLIYSTLRSFRTPDYAATFC
jgi:hypothetical protein